jgi:hypothetical protein
MSCSTKLPLSSWIWAKLVWAATSSNHAEELTPDAVGVRAFEGEFVAAESRHRGDRPRAFGHPARLVARQCAHMGRNVAAKLVDCRKIAAFRDAPGFKVRHQELQVHRGAGNLPGRKRLAARMCAGAVRKAQGERRHGGEYARTFHRLPVSVRTGLAGSACGSG